MTVYNHWTEIHFFPAVVTASSERIAVAECRSNTTSSLTSLLAALNGLLQVNFKMAPGFDSPKGTNSPIKTYVTKKLLEVKICFPPKI